MAELVIPSVQYKESFLAALAGYKAERWERYMDLDEEWLLENFDAFVQQIQEASQGKNLPAGYMQHTEFWLVEGDEFLGRLDIRPQLNDHLHTFGGNIGYDIRPDQRGKGYGKLILTLGLQKAKELGLQEILITCDANNVRSRAVIEKHGGVLENSIPQGVGKPDKNRYWIHV